jgi:hypothetical protein
MAVTVMPVTVIKKWNMKFYDRKDEIKILQDIEKYSNRKK